MKRSLALILFNVALVASVGCTTVDPTPARAKLGASETLKGTWRVVGFEPVVAGTEASVRSLNAQLGNPDAQAARITYSGDRVETSIPGKPLISSPYSVQDDAPRRVVLKDRVEEITITFADDDHATLDRKTHPYGARMKLERVQPAAAASKSAP